VAELRQQQAEAKPDATVSAGYERPNSGFSQRAFDAAEILAQSAKPLTTLSPASKFPCLHSTATKAQSPLIQQPSMLLEAALRPPASRSDPEVAQSRVRYQGAQGESPPTAAASANRLHEPRSGSPDLQLRQGHSTRRHNEQRRYIDIETGYTDVLLDAYAARVALEQAIGASLR